MNIFNEENISDLTVLYETEEKKDLMFAALEFCAQLKYNEDLQGYRNFVKNLSNENFLSAHIDNLLNTVIFLVWCGEYDDKMFQKNKDKFIKDTLALKKEYPIIFQFRLLYLKNHKNISTHFEKLEYSKKNRYLYRMDNILSELSINS